MNIYICNLNWAWQIGTRWIYLQRTTWHIHSSFGHQVTKCLSPWNNCTEADNVLKPGVGVTQRPMKANRQGLADYWLVTWVFHSICFYFLQLHYQREFPLGVKWKYLKWFFYFCCVCCFASACIDLYCGTWVDPKSGVLWLGWMFAGNLVLSAQNKFEACCFWGQSFPSLKLWASLLKNDGSNGRSRKPSTLDIFYHGTSRPSCLFQDRLSIFTPCVVNKQFNRSSSSSRWRRWSFTNFQRCVISPCPDHICTWFALI